MIDKRNLHRVKGILSAKMGTEIPKHQGGAKFAKRKANQTIYSGDNAAWFTDFELKTPYTGGLDGFTDVQLNANQPTMAIPGDPKLQPNSAVENAAATQAQINTQTQAAQVTAAAETATKFTPPPALT